MQPQVSVVIKSYNHEAYVEQSIRSVLDQSFQDFEIVVTDDASTDQTATVIRRFSDPRIRLEVSPSNQGISLAMNATLQRARGKYVAILNSDDFALPGRLERQFSFLETNPHVSALFGLPVTVDDAGNPMASFFDFQKPQTLPDFSNASWLRHFFFKGNCLCAPTAMIRRTALLDTGLYDARLTNLQDLDYWVRLLVKGHNLHFLPENFTAFRIRSGDMNASAPKRETFLRQLFETTQILKHYRQLSHQLITHVFAADIAAHHIPTTDSADQVLAKLALTTSSVSQCVFAFNTLFESANQLADFQHLRELTGRLDIFSQSLVMELNGKIQALTTALADKEATIRDLNASLSSR